MEDHIEGILEAKVTQGQSVSLIVELSSADTDWRLLSESTFGGKPIEPYLSQPRACDDEGNPRLNLYMFELLDKSDGDDLEIGVSYSLSIQRVS